MMTVAAAATATRSATAAGSTTTAVAAIAAIATARIAIGAVRWTAVGGLIAVLAWSRRIPERLGVLRNLRIAWRACFAGKDDVVVGGRNMCGREVYGGNGHGFERDG